MSRQRLGDKPLSNAEKQRRYRAKQKAEVERLQAAAQKPLLNTTFDSASLRETIKEELKTSWEPELKQARIEAERKKGREIAKKTDQNHEQGKIIGICEAAAFFTGKERPDIARSLLSHFMIDREKAAAALEADKRTKSLTLETLDKAKTWGKPPRIIK